MVSGAGLCQLVFKKPHSDESASSRSGIIPTRSLQGSEERVFVLTGGAGQKQRPKEVTRNPVSRTQQVGRNAV